MKAIRPEPWMEDALCAQVDPELWFPEQGSKPWEAKRICSACPVAKQCLAYALDNEEYGVWAGTTERERRPLRRGQREVDRCA